MKNVNYDFEIARASSQQSVHSAETRNFNLIPSLNSYDIFKKIANKLTQVYTQPFIIWVKVPKRLSGILIRNIARLEYMRNI